MTPEKHRAHAHLALQLIRACGTLKEAAGVCRLEKSRLQEFTDPTTGALMPIDVVEELQEYCGRPIYWEGVAAMLPHRPADAGVRDVACALTEHVVALQAYVRRATADGALSPRERREIERLVQAAETHLCCMRTASARGEP